MADKKAKKASNEAASSAAPETTVPTPSDSSPPPSPAEDVSKKEFEERQAQLAREQNLPEGGVPEVRPIASQTVDEEAQHSKVFKRLRDAGDDRAGAKAMPKSAYDKAASKSQKDKAAKEERSVTLLYPGARGWIDNPGQPDHGRAIAVNRVESYASVEDERIAAAGGPASRFAEVATYECQSRDGRAELLLVSAEHIRLDTTGGREWGKTPLEALT